MRVAQLVVMRIQLPPFPCDGDGTAPSTTPPKAPMIRVLVPGVSFPWEMFPHALAALLLSTGLHEAGHGLAALASGLPVSEAGILTKAFIPFAFVEIPDDGVSQLPPSARLRIFTGGIWHNLVVASFAMMVQTVGTAAPGFLPGWCSCSDVHPYPCVWVTDEHPLSLLYPLMRPGNTYAVGLRSIHGFPISNASEWDSVLHQLSAGNLSIGYCLPDDYVAGYASARSSIPNSPGPNSTASLPSCCTPEYKESLVCFLPDSNQQPPGSFGSLPQPLCLPGRETILAHSDTVSVCQSPCDDGSSCYHPRYKIVIIPLMWRLPLQVPTLYGSRITFVLLITQMPQGYVLFDLEFTDGRREIFQDSVDVFPYQIRLSDRRADPRSTILSFLAGHGFFWHASIFLSFLVSLSLGLAVCLVPSVFPVATL
eukprot:gene6339-11_t